MFTRENLNELRRTVRGLQTGDGDERAIAVIDRLLDAVYPVLYEMKVTPAEWEAALRFLGETDTVMMRGVAWMLGLSQIVQENNSKIGAAATAECIEGPFHRPDAPIVANGAPLHQVDDGAEDPFIEGKVLDTDGRSVADAELDVWAANGAGNYSFFDPSQPEQNCRGRLRSGADGRYRVFAPLPAGYHINVGPMGTVLKLMGHQVWRPAHVHFILTAPGHETLTTQLYFAEDPHLEDDPAIAVKDQLIVPLTRHASPEEIAARGVDRPFHLARFDFRLQPS